MTSKPAPNPFLDLILHGIRVAQITRYSELASSTIIVFDHLMTIDQEIELIWNAHWSIGKVLFIINRYYTLTSVVFNNYALFSTTLTEDFCLRWFQWQGWTGLIACMIAEIILQVRLYALYYLNKKILALMVTWFLAASAASAFVIATTLTDLRVRTHIVPGVPFCVPVNVPHRLFVFWIPIIAFESLLCAMALYRGLQGLGRSGRVGLFSSGRRLVGILVRDSILFFFVVLAAYSANLLVFIFGSDDFLEVPLGFSIAMSCVMGNRLIFNVRHLHKEMIGDNLPSTHNEPSKDGDVIGMGRLGSTASGESWESEGSRVGFVQYGEAY